MRREDFDIFVDKFNPLYNATGDSFLIETYGEDYEKVKKAGHEYVWTLLDCDGKMYLTPGIRWVNRMNYIICQKPWKEGQRDYFYG
jgi:hypothetical protein